MQFQPTSHPFFKAAQLEIDMSFVFPTGKYKWTVMYTGSETESGKLTDVGCHGFDVVANKTAFKWFQVKNLKNITVL